VQFSLSKNIKEAHTALTSCPSGKHNQYIKHSERSWNSLIIISSHTVTFIVQKSGAQFFVAIANNDLLLMYLGKEKTMFEI
jgi:hypothetical protein